MRLHLLGVPHTITHRAFSHCAFTQKVRRFGPMLRATGYEVIHYGIEGSDAGATHDVLVMTQEEHRALLGHDYHAHGAGFYGDDAQDGSPLYKQWNLYAREALRDRLTPGDLVCLPFGHAHAAAIRGLDALAGCGAMETGIGYYDCLLPWRIYESHAVRHATMAKEGRYGVSRETTRLEFVVPNYYDITDWPLGTGSGDYFAFMARLTRGKGLDTVLAMARAWPSVPFRIAGQGDIDQWGPLPANVEYVGVLHDTARAQFLGNARAIIAPSQYIEPFGGAVVEAALCGTPAITSDFGAFTETVEEWTSGFRCTTMRQYINAVELVQGLNRGRVQRRAQAMYSTATVGQQYARVFDEVADAIARGLFSMTGW